jgi:hypothetical protein
MCARLSKLTECRKYVSFTDVSATSHWADSWRPHPGSSIGLATANFQVGEDTLASYFVVVIAGRLLAGVRFVLMARGTTAYITVLSAATGDRPDAGLEQVTPIDALVNYSRPYSGSLASPQRAIFSQPSQSRAIQDSVRSDYDRHVPGSRRAMTVYMPFLSIFRASVHLPCLVVCHRNVHGIRCRFCALCS